MKRATTVVLALGALLGGTALPASAQVVIGGEAQPSVEVNWSVLDRLGRTPSLPDMLKSELPGARSAQPAAHSGTKHSQQGVQYRPYKAGAADKPAKKLSAAPAAKSAAKVTPVAAKSEPKPAMAREVQQLAEAAKKPAPAPVAAKPAKPDLPPAPKPVKLAPQAPVAAPVAAPAPVAPAKPAGPQISLPEVPKPEPVKAPEPAKAEAPKPVAPAPMQAAITPPPPPAPKAVEAAPVPVKAVEPPPAPVVPMPQIASLPPQPAPAIAAGSSMHGDTLSVLFGGDNAKLPDTVRADLDRLVRRMEKDESLGLQLLAYAGGDDANASKARRLSLSRALEVRKYLMEQGVRSTRIEVRALGNKVDAGPADRVDAVLAAR